jgi:hypothetical protein
MPADDARNEEHLFPIVGIGASSFLRQLRLQRILLDRRRKRNQGLQTVADQLLLQKYSPAAVLVNEQGDILYISGRTGKNLEPAAGKVNWNIFAMAREGLRYELDSAFQQALQKKDAIVRRNVEVKFTVQAIAEPSALRDR